MAARALPLQYIHRPPSAPLSCSMDQTECRNSLFFHQKEKAVKHQQQYLVRSRSSSLLQAKHQLTAVFKALLHRPSSHCHLNDGGHSLKTCHQLPEFAADQCCRTPKSCSSSKLVKSKCVPKGHVAVYVEAGQKRHVVPIAYLREPHFQVLLERAEREYGFVAQGPGLHLPCSFTELHHTLHQISSCLI